jgi:alkylation response protein AidB-like acyl-CoA dehydrogenase
MGMRGTGSHSVELKDVFVPEETVGVRRARGKWHGSWNVITTVAPALYMAPYVGAAERAATLARAALAAKSPDVLQLASLGQLENELLLCTLTWQRMLDLANDYAFEPKLEDANCVLMCKTLTANAAQRCVAKAIDAVGGSAFFRDFGLEQLMRDVQAGPFHLLTEKRQLHFSGRVALGLPPSA